jgi:hypothetical protein
MYKLPFVRHNLLCSLTAHARRQVHAGAIFYKTKNVSDGSNDVKQQKSMTEYYSRFTSEQFNVSKTDDDDVYEIVPQSTEEGDDELEVFSIVGLELGKTGVIEPEVCALAFKFGCVCTYRKFVGSWTLFAVRTLCALATQQAPATP